MLPSPFDSLRVRLTLLVLAAVLPSLALVVYSGLEQRQHEVWHAKNQALRLAKSVSQVQEHLIQSAHEILCTLAQMPQVQQRDRAGCAAFLASLLANSKGYRVFAVLEPNGDLLASAPAVDEPINYAEEPWYQRVTATRTFTTGAYQISKVSKKPVIVLAHPVLDSASGLKAIVVCSLDLDWLQQLVTRITLPEGATCSVTDHAGTVLARYPDSQEIVGKLLSDSPIFKMMSTQAEGVVEAPGLDGTPRIYGFTSFGRTPELVYVRVGLPKEIAFAEANRDLIRNVVSLGGVALLALLAAWVGADLSVLRGMRRLLKVTGEVSGGNLASRLGEPYGTGELGQLERAFDLMATSLEQREADRIQADAALAKVNRALRVLSECNQRLVRIQEEPTLLHEMCRLIVDLGGYRLAWVGLAEDNRTASLRVVAWATDQSTQGESSPPDGELVAANDGPVGWAVRTAQPCVEHDLQASSEESSWRALARRHACNSLIGLPLLADGEALGVLAIYAGEPDAFNHEEVGLLQELADDLAYGIVALRTRAEHRRAEESLEQRERYYRSILASMHEDILVIGPDYRIADVNRDVMITTGARRESIIGEYCHEVSHGSLKPCDHDGDACLLQHIFAAEESRSTRHEHIRSDGSKAWVDILFSPLKDEQGNTTHVIEAMRDVTLEVQMRNQLRQAQRMEAIGTLAGGIAHDFNNILGAILGYTELAYVKLPQDDSVRNDLVQVLKASDRAKGLIKQILTFCRQGEEERKPVALGPIVKEALKFMRASMPATIIIEQEITVGDGNDRVLADPTQIHQVLINLFTNASHAMREKGGVLRVSLTEAPLSTDDLAFHLGLHHGPYLRLSVTDTGHGIDPAIIERIFDPFFTTKLPGEGTGMGLSVVHGIVTGHDGAITVQSEPGRGTTFQVYLPTIEEHAVTMAEFNVSAFLPQGQERILFVDDEEDLANIWHERLSDLGYLVVAKTNSLDALEAFHEHPQDFDLIITDLTMPYLTGLDLATEVLSDRPDIPIIMCSGFSDDNMMERARLLGVREFLMKPVNLRDLAQILRATLDALSKPTAT